MQTAASGFNFKEVVVSFSSSTDVFVSIFIPSLRTQNCILFDFPLTRTRSTNKRKVLNAKQNAGTKGMQKNVCRQAAATGTSQYADFTPATHSIDRFMGPSSTA